jgi:hypothetical protein
MKGKKLALGLAHLVSRKPAPDCCTHGLTLTSRLAPTELMIVCPPQTSVNKDRIRSASSLCRSPAQHQAFTSIHRSRCYIHRDHRNKAGTRLRRHQEICIHPQVTSLSSLPTAYRLGRGQTLAEICIPSRRKHRSALLKVRSRR